MTHVKSRSDVLGVMTLTAGAGLLSNKIIGEQPKYSAEKLQFQTVQSDSSNAKVHVIGDMGVALGPIAASQQVDVLMPVVREEGRWRVVQRTTVKRTLRHVQRRGEVFPSPRCLRNADFGAKTSASGAKLGSSQELF